MATAPLLVGALEQQRELVAAEARERVARADDLAAKRSATCLQQLVAGVVAEAVVDLLEPVEVDEQHREDAPGALRARERLVEPVAEQGAVGEAGEPVVERLARQLLLEPDALGDVAGVEHDAADVAVARAGR